MPGVVQVLVLEFKGVSSSSKPSAKSLKVSMGKRQHQVWDRGEFSFPITKLREDLVIALMDASGNEIGHADIKTLEIIEKGCWDEVFSINESGHVHMKLQFVLSEDEKDRIRVMRESAMKKKPVDLSVHRRLLESRYASSQKSMNDEHDEDSQKEFIQRNDTEPTTEASEVSPFLNSVDSPAVGSNQQLEETVMAKSEMQDSGLLFDSSHLGRSNLSPPGMHGVETDLHGGHHIMPVETVKNHQPHVKAETEKVFASPVRKDVSKQKFPSKVRKMVIAFEDTPFQEPVLPNSEREVKILRKSSSVSLQSMEEEPSAFGISWNETAKKEQEDIIVKPLSVSSQFKKGESNASGVAWHEAQKDQESKNVKPSPVLSEVQNEEPNAVGTHVTNEAQNSFGIARKEGALEQEQENINPPSNLSQCREEQSAIEMNESALKQMEEENIEPPSVLRLCREEQSASGKATNGSALEKMEEENIEPPSVLPQCREEQSASGIPWNESTQKETEGENVKPSPVSSQFGNEEPSGITWNKTAQEQEDRNVSILRQSSGTTATISERMISEECQITEARRLSSEILPGKPVSLKSYTEECYSSQSSGIWIFPDNERRLCITTTGTEIMKTVKPRKNPVIIRSKVQRKHKFYIRTKGIFLMIEWIKHREQPGTLQTLDLAAQKTDQKDYLDR